MDKKKLQALYQSIKFLFNLIHIVLSHTTGGLYEIIATAIRGFVHHRSLEAAASIAYYALFSLFPLLIVLIAFFGIFLKREQAQIEVLRLLQEFFPLTDSNNVILQLVKQNLPFGINQHNSLNIFASASLLWAASSVFTVMARNINRAWQAEATPRDFLSGRLVAFGMMSVLAGLFILSLFLTVISNVLAHFRVPLGGGITIEQIPFWIVSTKLLSYFFSFALFLGVYRWVPNTYVRWSEAAWAALVAAIIWRLIIAVFTWVTNVQLMNYQTVYGSLATVVLAMFWIYLGSLILLFCAHLSAAIAHHRR